MDNPRKAGSRDSTDSIALLSKQLHIELPIIVHKQLDLLFAADECRTIANENNPNAEGIESDQHEEERC